MSYTYAHFAISKSQITSVKHRKYEWAIFFVRCCMILHNLILSLEGGNFDPIFRERLYEVGRGYPRPRIPDAADDEDARGSDDELQEARQHVETEGQIFRRQIMARLFSSEEKAG